MEENSEDIELATSIASMEDIWSRGKIAIFYGFQNGSPIEDNLDYLKLFYQMGVRFVMLTYNIRNFIGSGIRVLDIVYFAYSLRGSLFVIVLLGIYWKKTSQKGAICGIICTGIVGAFWVIYNGVVGHFPIHPAITETYAAVVTAFVTTVIFTKIFPKEKASK